MRRSNFGILRRKIPKSEERFQKLTGDRGPAGQSIRLAFSRPPWCTPMRPQGRSRFPGARPGRSRFPARGPPGRAFSRGPTRHPWSRQAGGIVIASHTQTASALPGYLQCQLTRSIVNSNAAASAILAPARPACLAHPGELQAALPARTRIACSLQLHSRPVSHFALTRL